MIAHRAGEGGTDAFLQFGGGEQPGWLADTPLAVDPLGLDRVEPGTPCGQETRHDAPPILPVSALVVLPQPAPDSLAAVPASVVPN